MILNCVVFCVIHAYFFGTLNTLFWTPNRVFSNPSSKSCGFIVYTCELWFFHVQKMSYLQDSIVFFLQIEYSDFQGLVLFVCLLCLHIQNVLKANHSLLFLCSKPPFSVAIMLMIRMILTSLFLFNIVAWYFVGVLYTTLRVRYICYYALKLF